jgi:hypothetical protein
LKTVLLLDIIYNSCCSAVSAISFLMLLVPGLTTSLFLNMIIPTFREDKAH